MLENRAIFEDLGASFVQEPRGTEPILDRNHDRKACDRNNDLGAFVLQEPRGTEPVLDRNIARKSCDS